MDAQTKLPAQLVRLRLLNAEIERGYVLGFSDDRPFYLISTDGGLIDKPIALKRIRLMVGERAEILVDLGQDKPGSSLEMMAYNSGQTFGFPGGEPDSGGANGSLLNDKDFRILKINIAPATVQKLTAVPTALKTNRYPQAAEATEKRRLNVTDGRPFFKFDGKSFDMHSSNIVVKLGATETWTITNNNIFGHSFHIHDVQFKILSRSNGEVPDYENGWKDTAYLPKGQSVTFVAKFEDYAS
ncbi:MAG: bilirubin oxidase, partial [Verrucomicrobia bacterium]|nr:bilirubin oxidase [Verrucomicrobiota bacterium]